MELIYTVEIEVNITDEEAALLYKYLAMHPETEYCVQEGHFAYKFGNFNTVDDKNVVMKFSTEIIDICLKALEDQNIENDQQNVIKHQFIEKLYQWGHIIYKEVEIIEELKLKYEMEVSPDHLLNKPEVFSKQNDFLTEGNMSQKSKFRQFIKKLF